MGKCVECGKSGLFLKLTPEKLCPKCDLLKEVNALVKTLEKRTDFLTEQLSDKEAAYKLIYDNAINSASAEINSLNNILVTKQYEFKELTQKIELLQNDIIQTEDEILMQSFGLFKPKYEFTKSELYKVKLEAVRLDQKNMIKANIAVTGNMNWTVNGSVPQGQKMVKDMQKLLLRSFNSECEEIVDRVTYSNFESSLKRITSSYEAISKLGKIMDVAITKKYYEMKTEELCIAFEYQQKKQEEKEEQKEIKAQLREEAKLQKEIEDERKKIEKEQTHYQSALSKLLQQIEKASEKDKEDLNIKKSEIESKLSDIEKALVDVDYRQANQKAGYVYVVSNIGAFGENIYKIGMTRRLDPQERIDELGGASVPFDFDVHAMIFSDNAPALENALHKAFENKKINWINTRREFFNVTLEEIKDVIKVNHDKTAEFVDLPEAQQYRVSEKMKNEKNLGN